MKYRFNYQLIGKNEIGIFTAMIAVEISILFVGFEWVIEILSSVSMAEPG